MDFLTNPLVGYDSVKKTVSGIPPSRKNYPKPSIFIFSFYQQDAYGTGTRPALFSYSPASAAPQDNGPRLPFCL